MRYVLLPFLLFAGLFVFAKDKPVLSPEPAWLYPVKPDFSKQVDLRKISNGYYLDLYDEQVNLNNQSTYVHFIRKIVNESGIQTASEVSVTFSPEYESLAFHFIRVIRDGEVINQLRLSEIKVVQEETDVDDYLYNGRKRAFLILKDIRKGDRIEAAYSVTGFNPVFNNKFLSGIIFANGNPILNYFQTIIADTARHLNFAFQHDCPKPEEQFKGGLRVYHWNNPPVKFWESISGAPAWFDPYPSVAISEFSSWQEVAAWSLDEFKNYKFSLPAKLRTRIEQWKQQAKGDTSEFIRLALRFVQDDIRYLGLEIGVNSHRPHPPAEVYANGYGDCKDKALLLACILKSENIAASAALVNTSLRSQLINKSPSPAFFDHVIVAIDNGGKFTYVDPTLSYQRGRVAEMQTPAYGYALHINEAETALRKIDPPTNNSLKIRERLKVRFADTSQFTVSTTYTGARAEGVRSSFATSSFKEMADSYEKYYATTFDGILMSTDMVIVDDTVNNSVKVEETYRIPNLWSEEDAGKKQFWTYARAITEVLPDPSGKPDNYPLALPFPSEVHYIMEIEMPEDWSLDTDNLHIRNDSYEFSGVSTIKGSHITLDYSIVTFKDHIPADMISQYKKDYKNIMDLLQYRYSYGGGSGTNNEVGQGVNGYSVLLALVVLALSAFAFYRLNQHSIDVPFERPGADRFGGWVAFLGVTLVLSAAFQLYNFYQANYFSLASYETWQTYGSAFVVTAFLEMAFTILWIAATFAVIYWYLRKRDIFPVMFNGYITLVIITQALMFLLYRSFAGHSDFRGLPAQMLVGLFRVIIYGAVWCTYLARSSRARATFSRAYTD